MTSSRLFHIARCTAASLLLVFSVAQAKEEKVFTAPPVVHANTFASHQEDTQDKVTVAVDPYDGPPQADIFTVDYQRYGLLPVQLIVSNDGDDAISLKGLKAELETGKRVKMEALREDEILERILRQKEVRPRVKSPVPMPIPLPHKSAQADLDKTRDEVNRARFSYLAVEPHNTRAGFLFFDTSVVSDAITGSYVYVSGVRNGQGQELLYFEIPLQKEGTK